MDLSDQAMSTHSWDVITLNTCHQAQLRPRFPSAWCSPKLRMNLPPALSCLGLRRSQLGPWAEEKAQVTMMHSKNIHVLGAGREA